MRSSSSLVVGRAGGIVGRAGDRRMDAGDVLVDVRCEPPVSIRRCGDRLVTVASSAGPVGGDELRFDIEVGPGARADIGSVAATILWPSVDGATSSTSSRVRVGAGGHLHWAPEPTISVAGSRHRTSLLVELAADAGCTIVEEVVLGRSDEPAGRLDLELRVERDGRALVHHAETFGPDVAGAGSVVSVGDARNVLTAVVAGVRARRASAAGSSSTTEIDSTGAAAWLPVADDVAVVLAVGLDRRSLLEKVDRMWPELLDRPPHRRSSASRGPRRAERDRDVALRTFAPSDSSTVGA